MVGKWHLGHHSRAMLPNQRGFEHFYGSLTGGIGYWNKVHGGGYDLQRNGVAVRDDGYVTHLLVDEIRRLIQTRDKHRPNFMYAAFQAPHLPNEAPEQTVVKYARLRKEDPNPSRYLHAAMVDELDQAIGAVLAIYAEQGMLDNTLILLMSDNGGLIPPGAPETLTATQNLAQTLVDWFDRPIPGYLPRGFEFLVANTFDGGSDNTPLPGAKGMIAEGGVRVPAALWWPGNLEEGTHTQQMTITDVLPTLLEAIGSVGAIPENIDGRSQLDALKGGASDRADYAVSGLVDGAAIYRWPWKLMATDPPRLFNVVEDPLEQKDLAASEAELTSTLLARLSSFEFAEDPGLPLYDLIFDPDTFGGEEDGRQPWPESVRH